MQNILLPPKLAFLSSKIDDVIMSIQLLTKMRFMLVIVLFIFAFLPATANAHSGRTDANGGHNCNVGACAGTYHYHNGGGGSAAPSTPNYIEQGTSSGKAHAQREAVNIRTKTTSSGYQAGYSAGISGAAANNYAIHPTSICDTNFTFDAGTNETYKTWYKSGWVSECNTIARAVYQSGYNEGFNAGVAASSTPTTSATLGSETTNKSNSNDWIFWTVIGGFVGVPILYGLMTGSKKTGQG